MKIRFSISLLITCTLVELELGRGMVSVDPKTTKATTTTQSSFPNNEVPFLSNEQRQKLIKKSQDYSATYEYTGWSNRIGKIITPIHVDLDDTNRNVHDVYSADRQFKWFSIDVGGRCTIIAMPPSVSSDNSKPDLFIHSPVELDDTLRKILAEIGTVKYVCSPNYEHVKYATSWYEEYKDIGVNMWGCPGLMEKMPQISWAGEIPYNYRPSTTTTTTTQQLPKCWDHHTILQPLHVNIEQNPFTGQPFFQEVVFYHVPTKSLLTTDLFWNYPNKDGITNSQQNYDGRWELAPICDEVPFTSRLWKYGMDQIYSPFYHNFMITNRDEYNNIMNHMLNVWDIHTIIPCHGDIIRGKENCQNAIKKALLLS